LGKTVVLGCGNPLAADDAVGLAVIRELKQMDLPPGVEVVEAGTPGIGLIDLMAGYDRAIIVDALISGAAPGTVHRFREDILPDRKSLPLSVHGMNAVDAILLGRLVQPDEMPAELVIVGVEITDRTPFTQGLSPAVAAAIPEAVKAVKREIGFLDC
jgi:hydrogenase maturation protease